MASADAPSWSSGGATLVEVIRSGATISSISLDGIRPEAVRRALGCDVEADSVTYLGEEVRGYWVGGWASAFALALVALVAIGEAIDGSGLARGVGLGVAMMSVGAIATLSIALRSASSRASRDPAPRYFTKSAGLLPVSDETTVLRSLSPRDMLRWQLAVAAVSVVGAAIIGALPEDRAQSADDDLPAQTGYVCLEEFADGLRAVFISPRSMEASGIDPGDCEFVEPP